MCLKKEPMKESSSLEKQVAPPAPEGERKSVCECVCVVAGRGGPGTAYIQRVPKKKDTRFKKLKK